MIAAVGEQCIRKASTSQPVFYNTVSGVVSPCCLPVFSVTRAAPKQRKQGGSSSGKSQPKHKVANNASTHNNSSGSCSNQALGWQWAQQLSALAYSRGAAAASAAAQAAQAAAAGYSVAQQQQHPAGVFGIQPTADNYAGLACLMRQQAADVSAGLGDPLSWSSVVPVHMLPMMDADKVRQQQ